MAQWRERMERLSSNLAERRGAPCYAFVPRVVIPAYTAKARSLLVEANEHFPVELYFRFCFSKSPP